MQFMHPTCGAGLSITNFESDTSALWINNGATVTLEGCTLSRNSISDAYTNSAVISVNAVDPDSSVSQQQDTILRLRQCTFSSNTANHTLVAREISPYTLFDVGIYSYVERKVWKLRELNGDYLRSQGTTLPLAQAPTSRPGIDASTPWLLNVQQV